MRVVAVAVSKMSWREKTKLTWMQAGRAGGSLVRPSPLLRLKDETGQDKTRREDEIMMTQRMKIDGDGDDGDGDGVRR